jgi:hypothetical protein
MYNFFFFPVFFLSTPTPPPARRGGGGGGGGGGGVRRQKCTGQQTGYTNILWPKITDIRNFFSFFIIYFVYCTVLGMEEDIERRRETRDVRLNGPETWTN